MKYIKTFENYIKPSYFADIIPMSCIFRKAEHEIIAQNIMTILSRTGNEFRDLSWEEYKQERLKDGNFSEREKIFFDEVIEYCSSSDKAETFSKNWNLKHNAKKDTEKYNL